MFCRLLKKEETFPQDDLEVIDKVVHEDGHNIKLPHFLFYLYSSLIFQVVYWFSPDHGMHTSPFEF